MKPGLLLLLSLCVFAAAMVPRHRRALDTESHQKESAPPGSSNKITICAATTPCAWIIYKPATKIVEMTISNTYCVCDKDLTCQSYQEDVATNVYVHRCRTPTQESES